MPKYGIQHIILNEAIEQLLNSNSSARLAAENLLNNPAAANLGAIGSDLLFWAPDVGPANRLYRFYENYAQFKKRYRNTIQKGEKLINEGGEPIAGPVESLAPVTVDLIRSRIEEIREAAGLFEAYFTSGLFAGVFTGANAVTSLIDLPSLVGTFFLSFTPPLQISSALEQLDQPEEAIWYWRDMLRYRKTGDFARRLIEKAHQTSGLPKQQAYAFGYQSHIATEMLGNAYINQVVGGPYRLQIHRHFTAANFMDSWKFHEYYNENINRTLLDKLQLSDTLDPSVRDLIAQTLRDVYINSDHPTKLPNGGFLSEQHLEKAYERLLNILNFQETRDIQHPEEPYFGVIDVIKNALGNLFEPPPGPPNSSGGGSCSAKDIFSFGSTEKSRDCYKSAFKDLAKWLNYVGELIKWSFEKVFELLDLLASVPTLLLMPVRVLFGIVYFIQLLLYHAYQSARSVLALQGFIYPDPEDLRSAHGRNLVSPFQCGIIGCPPSTGVGAGFSNIYPRWPDLLASNLVCPSIVVGGEQNYTIPNFAPANSDVTPNYFIQRGGLNLDNLALYARSNSPRQTDVYNQQCRQIGNAIALSRWMINNASNLDLNEDMKDLVFANWNLDADRGFGYKTWASNGIMPVPPLPPIPILNFPGTIGIPTWPVNINYI